MRWLTSLIKNKVGSRLMARIEEESRGWKCECPACGAVYSVWEYGGIRYKAGGTKKTLVRCRDCGGQHWMTVAWKPDAN
ncbi:hypothetical protein BVC71_00200 [Marivivens niveibacter]|uniref:Uncharacterized protein n=1 Tax=Marivivens niveibacter TaxID=1930667 RepID=A0A251X093_9RHOB|nr:hypothetical protein [Marivivens niveibacter]OUD09981.1 hypothetical protein BVC71_00200 [Marivivens niveibacter]